MRGYIQIYGGFRMSCKSRGKESEMESAQSHQETSDLIEKGIKYFSRTGTGNRPAIYFKIPACNTGSKKNLKVIYRQIEPLRLVRTRTYHSSAWIVTIIIFMVIDAVGKTSLYLGITRGLPTPHPSTDAPISKGKTTG